MGRAAPRLRLVATALAVVVTLLTACDASPAGTCDGLAATVVARGGIDAEGRVVVTGTAGNDVIVGTDAAEAIDGGAGDDVICAGGGDDLVTGGAGDDRIDGGPGVNTLHGGAGTDTCLFGPSFDECELPHAHVVVDQAPEGLGEALQALAAWMVDHGDPRPPMPDGLADHLAALAVPAPFELTLQASWADIGIFTPDPTHPDDAHPVPDPVEHRVAVADSAAGDVFLLVQPSPDSADWEVVGTSLPSRGSSPWFGPNERFVAVLGADARPACPFPIPDPGSYEGPCRPWRSNAYWENAADSIHLVTANVEDRSGALVGIPRHAAIDISNLYRPYHRESIPNPGDWLPPGSVELINDTMVVAVDPATGEAVGRGSPGGPATTAAVMAQFTGLPVEGYLVTQFGGGFSPGSGLVELVDAFGAHTGVGGLELTLSTPVNWLGDSAVNDDPAKAHWPEGVNLLDGLETLRLARERKASQPFDPDLPAGDYTRQYRGSLIIHAALAQAQAQGWLAIPGLLEVLCRFVATDLDAAQLLTLAATAFELDPTRVESLTVAAGASAQELITGEICQTEGGTFKPVDCSYYRSIDWFDLVPGRYPRPLDDPSIPASAGALWDDLADGHLGP